MKNEDEPISDKAVRVNVDGLDAILGKRLPCLDDGFVRVVDYLGGDASIVQAARISYGSGTRTVHEDRGLIRYLLRHKHTTPFEMCEIKLHVRVPMDTWRQWIRHRTANVNEYSTRYSVAIDRTQTTAPDQWRIQSTGNRQGASGFADAQIGRVLSEREGAFQAEARRLYQERIDAGIAREQARKDLPLSTYTEAYWKIDLWNLLHFLGLRMEGHAQEEIRQYAQLIGNEIVRVWVPLAWQAFVDYDFNSVHLSSTETEVLRALLAGDREGASAIAQGAGWLALQPGKDVLRANRERDEFVRKMRERFGYEVNWRIPAPLAE
jgi:thymidylate synthase (FAD)